MIKSLIKLYKDHRVLVLLDLAYLVLSILSFMVAGIVALFNQSLGISILIVPLTALVACVMNIVAWALVKLVMDQLTEATKPSAKNK